VNQPAAKKPEGEKARGQNGKGTKKPDTSYFWLRNTDSSLQHLIM